MKRLSFHFALLFVSFFCICGMCSKSDNSNQQPPAVELEISEGFLCTFGIINDGAKDTVVLRYGPAEPVIEFYGPWIGTSFIRDKHTWSITNAGNNTWRIRYADGRYLGYKKYEYNTGETSVLVTLDQTPGEGNAFVINKTDNKFVIQPVMDKKFYLNTRPVGGQPYQERHGFVHFVENEKQYWFLVP